MRWLSFAFCGLMISPLMAAPPDFDQQIAPLLVKHCLDCHSGADPKGQLDLSRKASARAVIDPGRSASSELWTRVAANDMPPKHPLNNDDKALLKSWIDGGAAWGRDPIDPFALTTQHRAGRDWWALKPLRVSNPSQLNLNIDAFIRKELAAKGLKPSPPADPRTLVRRLSFDLLGLPPTQETVEQFAKDPSEAAYRKLVDDMLASPHYGERWARHWLDLVRYGESDSFERNEPRPNAWHYRDWVIRSLNEDMPFDRFARLQLAGDVLEPQNPESLKATGFLVAGIHNTVLGSNKIANETARQDELEDILAAVGQTFLGLTIQCARCHDHKFDPVSQADYYRLTSVLGGVYHGERVVDPPSRQARRKNLLAQIQDIEARRQKLELLARDRVISKRARATAPVELIGRWSFESDARDSVGTQDGELKHGAKIANGRLILDGRQAHLLTKPLSRNLTEKTLEAWVQLSTLNQAGGGVLTIETLNGGVFDSIVFAERQERKWIAGSNHFARTQDVAGLPESKPDELTHLAITYSSDGRVRLYRNGKPYGHGYHPGPAVRFRSGEARIAIGMRHSGGTRAFLAGEVEEARIYDRALPAEAIEQSFLAGPNVLGVTLEEMLATLSAAERTERLKLLDQHDRLRTELAKLAPTTIYAVNSKSVPPTFVLSRGRVDKPLSEVGPGGVASVLEPFDFQLAPDAPEGLRRAKLAEWMTRKENPLFARVIVNRLWQHHFGVGLVETPSDFGFNGGRPTHPELLDWLANELIKADWSLKQIHRLILTSATYRQSAEQNPAASALDAENRLLWRKSPVRLEAEAIRDAILVVSGQLNRTVGGPPFHDVRTYGSSGTKYYEPIDPVGAEFNRRTIYRFSPRGERSTILETYDCPEPSALTPRRQITTTPLQALALWNNSFVLRMCQHFAERVESECRKAGDRSPRAKVHHAYALVFARQPTPREVELAVDYVGHHGLAAFARVLFNSHEFVVIE